MREPELKYVPHRALAHEPVQLLTVLGARERCVVQVLKDLEQARKDFSVLKKVARPTPARIGRVGAKRRANASSKATQTVTSAARPRAIAARSVLATSWS